jgi:hypothetical protein
MVGPQLPVADARYASKFGGQQRLEETVPNPIAAYLIRQMLLQVLLQDWVQTALEQV